MTLEPAFLPGVHAAESAGASEVEELSWAQCWEAGGQPGLALSAHAEMGPPVLELDFQAIAKRTRPPRSLLELALVWAATGLGPRVRKQDWSWRGCLSGLSSGFREQCGPSSFDVPTQSWQPAPSPFAVPWTS